MDIIMEEFEELVNKSLRSQRHREGQVQELQEQIDKFDAEKKLDAEKEHKLNSQIDTLRQVIEMQETMNRSSNTLSAVNRTSEMQMAPKDACV